MIHERWVSVLIERYFLLLKAFLLFVLTEISFSFQGLGFYRSFEDEQAYMVDALKRRRLIGRVAICIQILTILSNEPSHTFW